MISIILPTYNRASTLKRAIHSVLAQDFEEFELIVVNDGSTDNTNEILASFQDPRLRALHLPENKGVSHARNRGIDLATQPWIAFLDSDDEWLPNKLSQQIEFAEQNPNIKLVHGEEIWIRNGKKVNPHKKHKKSGGRIFTHCLPLCCISPSTAMIHKDLLKEVGNFKEDYPVCEDYDLWLRICSKYEVGFVSEALIKKYGGHEDQLSRKYFAMDYWRIKSLNEIKDSPHITNEERSLVISTILKKSEILLNGYRKHNNLENYEEVSTIHCLSLSLTSEIKASASANSPSGTQSFT